MADFGSTAPTTGHNQVDGQSWYGGGCDLTPVYLFEEDAVEFHNFWKVIGDLGCQGSLGDHPGPSTGAAGRTPVDPVWKMGLWGCMHEEGERLELVCLARRQSDA